MTTEIHVADSWPYVTERHKNESEEHIHLKNLAVGWLLDFGFTVGDIEIEHPIPKRDSGGNVYTDVYAERDGFEVYVECERGAPLPTNLSGGGSSPAQDGKLVYFLNTENLYRVRHTTVTAERKYSPGAVYESPSEAETHEFTRFEFDLLGPIPSPDGDKYQYSPEAQRREREKVSWL